MLKPTKYIFLFFLTAFLFSCSSSKQASEEASDNNSDEVYVFDDVGGYGEQTSNTDSSDVAVNQNEPEDAGRKYIVQVGAFTSQARAERFVTVNQNKVGFQMQISYSDKVNLYVVQLPPFPSRKDAENVRDNLWSIDTFRDAFIVAE